jgi:hypothetical protein
MLRQEELAFVKALGSVELSPTFLRELRKALAAGKRRKALVATKANARSSPASERTGNASGGACSPSCPRTFNWQGAFGARELKLLVKKTNGPFQGPRDS